MENERFDKLLRFLSRSILAGGADLKVPATPVIVTLLFLFSEISNVMTKMFLHECL